MNRQFRITVPAILLALLVTACGGSKSPLGPSDQQPNGGGSTAIVTGSVRGGSSSAMLSASAGQSITGLTVTVVGTTLTATVDAAGVFTISGIPPGTVQLKFTGPGVDATISLAEVQAAQNITIVVSVAGTTATLDAELRSGTSGTELEGRIESLPPTMAAGTIKVGGRTVRTDANTRIEDGSVVRTLADLEIGLRVHVKGTMSGSDVLASLIRIQNTNTSIPVEVNGEIDTLAGTASAFQFNIGSRVVKGDTLTGFFGDGSASASFADLEEGVRVVVKGQQRDGYIYATRIHIAGDDDDDGDDQDSSASIQGKLTAMSGTAPALTLTVGGTTVRTTGDTEVKRRGDVQTLAELKLNQTLHVIGTRQSDGSIVARRIEINDDETGGEFEIEGSMGGLKGACPVITFSVNGFSVATTASTTFEDGTCGALKSGTRVQVKGTRNADGSVTATLVKTK